jgi:ATP-dependent Clp protease ATP-binding subunit ClpA
MKSRHSSSLILVWRVAEVEASRLNAQEVEPMHLLIGLCKVVDLDLPALVSKDTPDRDAILEELLREVRRVRTVLSTAQVDARALRRKLRGKPLGQRFQAAESETLHRSAASRKVFADAEHFAQLTGNTVFPAHLIYAALLHEDEACGEAIKALGIDNKRFLEVARREVIFQQADGAAPVNKPKTHWN